MPVRDGDGGPAPPRTRPTVGESFPGGLPSGISVRYASIMDEVLTVALPDVLAQPAAARPLSASPFLQLLTLAGERTSGLLG